LKWCPPPPLTPLYHRPSSCPFAPLPGCVERGKLARQVRQLLVHLRRRFLIRANRGRRHRRVLAVRGGACSLSPSLLALLLCLFDSSSLAALPSHRLSTSTCVGTQQRENPRASAFCSTRTSAAPFWPSTTSTAPSCLGARTTLPLHCFCFARVACVCHTSFSRKLRVDHKEMFSAPKPKKGEEEQPSAPKIDVLAQVPPPPPPTSPPPPPSSPASSPRSCGAGAEASSRPNAARRPAHIFRCRPLASDTALPSPPHQASIEGPLSCLSTLTSGKCQLHLPLAHGRRSFSSRAFVFRWAAMFEAQLKQEQQDVGDSDRRRRHHHHHREHRGHDDSRCMPRDLSLCHMLVRCLPIRPSSSTRPA
jgi:hypothetical protein